MRPSSARTSTAFRVGRRAHSPVSRARISRAGWSSATVIYEEPSQGERDHLRHPRLLFTSNFDGQLDAYLEALRTGLGDGADAIWGHCIAYPGGNDADPFARYLRHHQIDSSLFFACLRRSHRGGGQAQPRAPNPLHRLRPARTGPPPAELKSAFVQEFGS